MIATFTDKGCEDDQTWVDHRKMLLRINPLITEAQRTEDGTARWLVSFAAWRPLRFLIVWETGGVDEVEQ